MGPRGHVLISRTFRRDVERALLFVTVSKRCYVLFPPLVVNCSDPGFVENAIRHGQQNFPESFEYGTSVMYHCKKGFYLLGSSALTCMANGLWDRSLPKCLGK